MIYSKFFLVYWVISVGVSGDRALGDLTKGSFVLKKFL